MAIQAVQSDWLMWPQGGERRAAVEHADVVQAEEAALEDVAPFGVLAVHPPGEVEQQLVEDPLQEREVARVVRVRAAALFAVDLEHAPGGPAVHRRVGVAERPLVGGQLAIGMHVPFPGDEHELVLGELRVQRGERDGVERQIPGGVPWVFPLVGHGDDIGVVEVGPFGVAAVLARFRDRRAGGVAVEPLGHVQVEELLAPDHAGVGLPLHQPRVRVRDLMLQVPVEGIRFLAAQVHDLVERVPRQAAGAQPDPHHGLASGFDPDDPMGRRLGAHAPRIDRARMAIDDVVVERVLEGAGRGVAPEQGAVGLVLGEQELPVTIGAEQVLAQLGMAGEETVAVDGLEFRNG